MTTNVKTLKLGDVIFQRQGAFIVRFLQFVFSIALRIFFRRIELVNTQNIPQNSGLIFVMNHQNALIDAALVFFTLPRKISFLGKSTIFKMPVLGSVARAVEALPVYRQSDAKGDTAKNQETFRLCRELLKKNGAIAIFPEGISHNEPRLMPLKTGAARIALGAVSVGQNPNAVNLQIVPLGIYYTNKTDFRSEAMLCFGKPFPVLPVELNENGEPEHKFVKELNVKIENALREVTINAESENEMQAAGIAEEIVASVYEKGDPKQTLADKFEFLRDFVEINEETTPEGEDLEKRLAKYDKKLNKLGIDPEHLALPHYSQWSAVKYLLSKFWYLILLSPLAIVGTILHFPAYQLTRIPVYFYARNEMRDVASTIKIFAGMLFMPLTWLILAGILDYYFGWKIALLSIPISFLCGYVALRTFEELEEMRGWINAAWLFLSKRDKFLRLLVERRKFYEELKR